MPPPVQQIGGQLPFAQPNFQGMFSGTPQGLAQSYQSAYNSALGQNSANYQNILSGYQTALANQTSAQDAIGKGYTGLYNDVLKGIQGIDQSQRQAIQDAYAQQTGQATQQLTSAGLGNTTVTSAVQRGIGLDKSKADIALSNQTAQLQAGYQSQLGQAGLNFQNQAAQQNTALQAQQLGWMNSVSSLYPNAQQYAQLLMQQGQLGQANADRAQAQGLFDKQQQAAQAMRGAAGGGGSIPPNYRPGPDLGPMGGGGGGYGGGLASVTPFGLGGGSPMSPAPGISSAAGVGAGAFSPGIAGAVGGAAAGFGGLAEAYPAGGIPQAFMPGLSLAALGQPAEDWGGGGGVDF